MIISHRHRYIFIHCRKSAGSAIKVSLARDLGPFDFQLGGWADASRAGVTPNLRARLTALAPAQLPFVIRSRLAGEAADQVLNRAVKRAWKSRAGLGNFPTAKQVRHRFPRAWAGYCKFCVVRNPFDRVVSDYFYRTKKLAQPPDFAEFVDAMYKGERLGGRVKIEYSNWEMYTIDDRVAVDHVVRYEDLVAGLEHVFARIGLEWDGWLPATKTGRSRPGDYRSMYSQAEIDKVRELCAREIETFGYTF